MKFRKRRNNYSSGEGVGLAGIRETVKEAEGKKERDGWL